jgi:hypothetical protein
LGAVTAVAISLVGLTTPAFARGNGKPSGGSPTGSCSVSPNPVVLGGDYTLTGSGLGAFSVVNVLIADSGGTTSWNLLADATGTTSITWHSYATGTSHVTIQESARHHTVIVASCSFPVI